MLKNTEAIGRACHSQEVRGGAHARRRSASGRDVQLRGPRAAGARGSSPAGDPDDGRLGAPGAVARVRATVPEDGSALDPAAHAPLPEDGWPLDPAGEAAPRPAAPDALLGPERTAADGAAGLQSALPLVRGPEHG